MHFYSILEAKLASTSVFLQCEASLSESPEEEEDTDTPGTEREASDSRPVASLSAMDPWSGSPRKRTQTLPTLNCPTPSGKAGKVEALSRWSRIQESSEEKTLSEDIFKILDLESSSLFGGTQKTGDAERDRATERRGSDITATNDDPPKPTSAPLSQPQPAPCEKKTKAIMAAVSVPQPDQCKAASQEHSQGNSGELRSVL